LFLLWVLLGLPSLAFAYTTVRTARAAGPLGAITRHAFNLLLAVCALVPMLASLAIWRAGLSPFPWPALLVTAVAALAVWLLALRLPVRPQA
jgi:hypothetical protein